MRLAYALLLLGACQTAVPDRPAGYPAGYPLVPGGQPVAEAKATELRYPQSANVVGDLLLGALAQEGWTVTLDSKIDPSAGRLIGATKDGRSVIANLGEDQGKAILVVKEAHAPPNP